MICPGCSKHNADDVRFCRHCGGKLERRTCSNGHTLPEGTVDCPYCPKATAPRRTGTVVVTPQRTTGATKLAGFAVTFDRDESGRFWPLRVGRTTVGSGAASDICLADPDISAEHAVILIREADGGLRAFCEDRGSQNGTRLGGDEIFNERPTLSDDDILGVGSVELKIILL